MTNTGRTLLIIAEFLAASIWVGSLVCLALVSRVAAAVLEPGSRVALFRGIGRLYGIVGTCALIVAIAAGLALAGSPSDWTWAATVAIVLSGLLVLLTAVGIAQARRMTVVRRQALASPDDEAALDAVRRGGAIAGALRGLIGLVTVVILVLVAHQLAT